MIIQRTMPTVSSPTDGECFRGRCCPVCGERRVEVLHKQQLTLPAEFKLPEEFDVVACVACEMVYSDTIAESEQLTAHYRADSYLMHNWEHHIPDTRPGHALGAPLDIARLRVVVELLSELLPVRDLRILDIGCASGTLLALLGEAGFSDVQGVDPSPTAVAAAHRLGQRAQVGDLDTELAPDMGTFDVVILSHVLEHLGSPREALRRVRSFLRPGGVVYAEVPDAARYAEFLTEPFVDFNHEHINHFSMSLLDKLFRESGFSACRLAEKLITVVNWPYAVLYGVWIKLDAVTNNGEPAGQVQMRDLSEGISAYIRGSRQLVTRYNSVLSAKLGDRRQVAVRCLGYRAWTLLGSTILRDLDVVAYIDSAPSKQGLTVRGIRITSPEMPIPTNVPIVVLAYHVERQVLEEYSASDPTRELIAIGRSRPLS